MWQMQTAVRRRAAHTPMLTKPLSLPSANLT